MLVGEPEDDKYIQLMNRGGLQFPSQALCDYVCSSFAVLDAINLTLMKYPLKARFAAELALQTVELSTEFFCDYHKELVLKKKMTGLYQMCSITMKGKVELLQRLTIKLENLKG